jgi:methyl-accepting chemotaxis protein
MSINSDNIARLAERSEEIDLKINSASSALRSNVDASHRSVQQSENMALKIREIIQKVSEMSSLSQGNQEDIQKISHIAVELYTAATNLNSQLGQFKS